MKVAMPVVAAHRLKKVKGKYHILTNALIPHK